MKKPQAPDIVSAINVTPMVDVMLVLLIIFMVITPVVQMGYLVRVPPKAPPNMPAAAATTTESSKT